MKKPNKISKKELDREISRIRKETRVSPGKKKLDITSFFSALSRLKPSFHRPKPAAESREKGAGESSEMKSLKRIRPEKTLPGGKHRLRFYLKRAGMEWESYFVSKRLFLICIFINLFLSGYLIFRFSTDMKYGTFVLTVWILILWGVFFALLLLGAWLGFYLMLDVFIYQRKVKIEEVLPDFLQLTSANVRAGMPLDRALWYAVRPKFGILSKEIETVAKETMTGVDLEVALKNFASKYDSLVLQRSMSLLIEGMGSGGEVGELLNKIALNIQESQILVKEMSADVTSYSLFIAIATIFAAPFLFALSGQLMNILKNIISMVSTSSASASTGSSFAFKFAPITLTQHDFTIFAVTSLIISSFFSSVIVATIRKGNVKAGINYLPIFVISTTVLYFIMSVAFGALMAGMGF